MLEQTAAKPVNFAVNLHLQPSRYLHFTSLLLHVLLVFLVLGGFFLSAVSPWFLVLCLLLAVVSLYCCQRQTDISGIRYNGSRWFVSVRASVSHNTELEGGAQCWQSCSLCGPLLVWPCLLILNFQSEQAAYRVVLLPDSATADELRQLKVLLNMGAGVLSR